MSSPRIFVIYYSMYGHVRTLANKIAEGAREAGAVVELYQMAETLPQDVLEKMHAPPKSDDPIIDVHKLPEADGIIFGFPTRFGMMPSQAKAMFDATGSLWLKGALVGKPAGLFFSTSTQNGGQETTALTAVTQLTHHGMLYVPIGYSTPDMLNMDEIKGGSPYGAGTLANGDGSRQPSEIELKIAKHQGTHFAKIAAQLKRGAESQ